MAMSKKHYQAIARALYEAVQTQAHEDARIAAPSAARYLMAHVMEGIARVLAADNPRFDRERFVEACETGRCKGMKAVEPTGAPYVVLAAREGEPLPPCVRAMRCYCVGHANGLSAEEPCDTNEERHR